VLLDAEADHHRGDDSLTAPRAALGTAYDRYVAAYGPLNRATVITGQPDPETGLATVTRRRPRMGGFRQDPDYVTVLALENYDEETGAATKAPIFFRRVNQPPRRPDRAETPAEAIRLCLDARGSLDLDLIGRLLGIPASGVPERLGELAYLDPASGDWVTAEEYLSGNVRAKLHAARQAASAASGADDAGRWLASVGALERVQPADLEPGEIRARPGAPWIPPADVRDFAEAILGHPPDVTCLRLTAQWEVKARADLTDTPAATEEWGTGRIDGYRLLELTLNGRAPIVYDVIETPDGEARIRNQAETILAEDKQRAMAERFAEWAWEDPGRCDRLCAEYNRRFNSVVPRRYDGSHLTFPGLADGFTPYPHQLDMVHRIVSSAAALCPYPVGTGKTPTMFMAARKLRELGMARKPLIIVPNHLLEQTAAEGKRLFPAARILMAAREDLASAQGRKLFAARCATGDWDAVVMTHSAFTAIPVHPATEADHLSELACRYRQALAAAPDAGKRGVKQMAKMVDAFETRARHLLDHRTDDGVWFEHLGVDFLMVDEAHYFKNLGVPVRTDGFAVTASKRATDLNMKLGLLRQRGTRTAALFTGTPVSNSLLEMYVLQHYLQPDRLAETGLDSADAWAATFVEFQTAVEVTPDGSGFRMKRRPVRFENVPELLTLFGEVADLRSAESFDVRRPAARHHTVLIPAGPELLDYVAGLAGRADRLRQVDAHQDNMLKICGDGRKAALDLGLVGIAGSGLSKVDAVIGNITRIYHAHRDLELPGDGPGGPRGGFQIVFCDLGTPDVTSGGGAGVYGKIRDGLVAAGVPAGQVRFIHEAATDARKAALFADCRAGKVAVLLGSTDKLGVGTNIQTRCVALHHVDAPWRPADVEQREGRALRPGNLCPQVGVFRYVSEKSFDSFMWQALERKARFIGQVMSGRLAGRDVDDIGDATLSFAEVKAIATGNPLLLDMAEASATVTRLRQLAAGHSRGVRRLSDSVAGWRQQAAGRARLAGAWQDIADQAARYAEPGWQDDAGNHVAAGDVAGFLAGLAERGLSGPGHPVARRRGLRIAFSARRDWRQEACVATISAGRAELPVEFSPSWVQKGQHWRIEKELADRVTGAAGQAERLREQVAELETRVADAQRRMAEPFPRAAELEAARVRRDQIEQQIREAATVPGDGEKPAPAAGIVPDRAAERRHADLGLAGLGEGHEVVVFTPEIAHEWASSAEALLVVPDGAAESGTTGPLADDLDRGVPGQWLSRDAGGSNGYVKFAGGGVPAGEPETLFALPESAAPDPVQRPAKHRRPRRGTAQLAALDTPTQPALFDLPAPPAARPARSSPQANKSPAPRK
jgi:N12 class adenine-specific DNA methylase